MCSTRRQAPDPLTRQGWLVGQHSRGRLTWALAEGEGAVGTSVSARGKEHQGGLEPESLGQDAGAGP